MPLNIQQKEIKVSAKAAGNQVLICVNDNGSGISPEKLEHVFDRFYRGDTNSNIQGFGLGLPIAKALIEGQGGKIEIQSKSPQGTTVMVGLPLTKDKIAYYSPTNFRQPIERFQWVACFKSI